MAMAAAGMVTAAAAELAMGVTPVAGVVKAKEGFLEAAAHNAPRRSRRSQFRSHNHCTQRRSHHHRCQERGKSTNDDEVGKIGQS